MRENIALRQKHKNWRTVFFIEKKYCGTIIAHADQCSSLLWVTLAHAPGKKATHKHWLPQRQLEKSERVLVFCWVFLFVFWGFCLFFGGELLFIVTYCCGHVVEGGFQQIKILVYIRIHWLQADEVIQKVIHLSNIEQSDKNLLHYHVLISNITKACVWQ